MKQLKSQKKIPYESKLRDTDFYNITHRNLNKLIGEKIYPDDDEKEIMTVKQISKIYRKSPIDTRLRFNQRTNEVLLDDDKPKITTVTFEKKQMDKYLNNKESIDLLNFYGLKLPSEYKDKSLEEFQEAFDKGMNEAANLKKSIKDVANYKKRFYYRFDFSFSKSWRKCKRKNKRTYRRL